MHWRFDASRLQFAQICPEKTSGIVPGTPRFAETEAGFFEHADDWEIREKIFDNREMIEKASVHNASPVMHLRLLVVADALPMAIENAVAGRLALQGIPERSPGYHFSPGRIIFEEKHLAPYRDLSEHNLPRSGRVPAVRLYHSDDHAAIE